MNTILLIIAAVGLLFLLVFGFQMIQILSLKKKSLQKEIESPAKKEVPAPSVIGETKVTVRKSLSVPANRCPTDGKQEQPTKKPITFAPESPISESGIANVPDDELDEIDVEEPDEVPDIVKCFDEEPEPVADGSVMAKELDSLTRLMKEGRLSNNDDEKKLAATVSKIDGTKLFDAIIEKFQRTTQGKLLEEFRQKVREKELTLFPSKENGLSTTNEKKEMSTEELMKLID